VSHNACWPQRSRRGCRFHSANAAMTFLGSRHLLLVNSPNSKNNQRHAVAVKGIKTAASNA
jgi:hypothetical protein